MELTDILSKDEWAKFEKALHENFHMNCTVYDTSGIGITGQPNWCNELCPAIKANKDSLAAICAPGNQYFMAQAKKTKWSVIGECDAGLMKIAVPIFINGDFLGTAGGCARLPKGGTVETYIIEKTTGLSKTDISELCRGLTSMSEYQADHMAEFIKNRISEYVKYYVSNS